MKIKSYRFAKKNDTIRTDLKTTIPYAPTMPIPDINGNPMIYHQSYVLQFLFFLLNLHYFSETLVDINITNIFDTM